jgi:Protein of unknown function (DUF3572)
MNVHCHRSPWQSKPKISRRFQSLVTASESVQNALQFWQSYVQRRDNADQSTPRNRQPPLQIVSYGTWSATGQYMISHDPHMKTSPPFRTPLPRHRPHAGKAMAAAQRLDAARELAIAALAFIADVPEEMSRFLALSGIDPGAVRAAAAEPGFLGGVLAYIAGNERTLLAFAATAGIPPEEVEKARIVLAGADWEREVP